MKPRDRIGPALEAARAIEPKRGTRKNCTFRQRDLAAGLRAAKQTGHEVQKILIEDGKICIVIGAPEPPELVSTDKTAPQTPKQVWLDLARKRS